MDPRTRVRQATTDDVPELVRLRHAMFRDMVAAGVGAHPDAVDDDAWYPAAHRAFTEQIAQGRLGAFVVDAAPDAGLPEGRRRLVASAVAAPEERLPGPGFPLGRTAHMSTVYVDPDHRRRGLARAVVVACLSWAEAQGAEIVDLHATPDAAPLPRSLGFREPVARALRRVPSAASGL